MTLKETRNKRGFIKRRRKHQRRGRVVDLVYLKWVREQPCCVTGERGRMVTVGSVMRLDLVTVHHVRKFGSQKDDTRTIPLLQSLHQLTHCIPGTVCVEHGKMLFEAAYGVDVDEMAVFYRHKFLEETK